MASADLEPIPLPSEPVMFDKWQKDRPQYLSAYNLAFDAEKYAAQQAGSTRKKNVVFARVAGFLLVELFKRRATLTEGPCEHLSKELLSDHRERGTTNDVVFQIGEFYCNHFLRAGASHFFRMVIRYLNFSAVRTTTTPYLTPSMHPSRRSFDSVEEMIRDSMYPDGKDYRTSRRKVRVLGHFALSSLTPD